MPSVERTHAEDWVNRYARAWGSNDPGEIGDLFTEDARYYTAPYREPWSGREAIVEGWLDRKDEPGQWEFRHQVLGISDDLAFVRGWTTYPPDDEDYSNLWVIRLGADGRCSEFIEWWMLEGEG
jgi:uncharacterized protein (TIGR02246 family)